MKNKAKIVFLRPLDRHFQANPDLPDGSILSIKLSKEQTKTNQK